MQMRIQDFMNEIIETPEVDVDEEYLSLEKQYLQEFGHIVPREMLPSSITEAEIKNAMKKCIELRNDNIFEVLDVSLNKEYLY